MILEIDFNSDEAIYVQLRNQIIMGIACEEFADGESLPSVRQLAQAHSEQSLCDLKRRRIPETRPKKRCSHKC